MRYSIAMFLLIWVMLVGTARAGHVPPAWPPDATLIAGPAWDIAFGKPMTFADRPPKCAFTGICDQKPGSRVRCADRPECTAFPPYFSGQGARPRGYAFGNDNRFTGASGAAANISIPPSALLFLGCALFIPLLSPRRTRRRRQ